MSGAFSRTIEVEGKVVGGRVRVAARAMNCERRV